ncbi:MAG: DMT family transporter [Candidatus Dormibacteraeota bacterium]|nr:DMT family transporter [Candidatus Dormibacteraeota bacterium]
MPTRQWTGTAMVLASATGFGSLAILAKLAYAQGLGAEQALAFRFVLAAVGMVALSLMLGQNPLRLERTRLITLLAMGVLGYSAQSLSYFLALRSLPASLVVLIAYIYPSLVVAAGWLFLHRAVSPKHLLALAASFVGLVMLVGGAHFQLAWALVLAVASPVIYTAYILVGERVMGSVPALAASAVIITGAAAAFCFLAAISNQLALPLTAGGWAVAVGLAVFPTMLAISLFLAGLPRVGAARAALLSTWEPVVTVGLAVLLLGDRLSLVQVLGGILVLLAVVVVQGARLWKPAQD